MELVWKIVLLAPIIKGKSIWIGVFMWYFSFEMLLSDCFPVHILANSIPHEMRVDAV